MVGLAGASWHGNERVPSTGITHHTKASVDPRIAPELLLLEELNRRVYANWKQSMSETIKPALSPFQWNSVRRDGDAWSVTAAGQMPSDSAWVPRVTRATAPLYLALANHALPDSDQRKITRNMVNALRETADDSPWDENLGLLLNGIADVLESYLPPK